MGCAPSKHKVKPDTNGNIYGNENRMSVEAKSPILGDVTGRLEARRERHKRIAEKQNKILSSAQEMSGKIMDERERLSLSTRVSSRNTSRNTSRTTSPVMPKKHVKFAIDKRKPPTPDKMPTKSDPDAKMSVTARGDYMLPDEKGFDEISSRERTEDVELPLDLQNMKSTKPLVMVSICSPRHANLEDQLGVPSAIEVT